MMELAWLHTCILCVCGTHFFPLLATIRFPFTYYRYGLVLDNENEHLFRRRVLCRCIIATWMVHRYAASICSMAQLSDARSGIEFIDLHFFLMIVSFFFNIISEFFFNIH